MSKNLLSAVHLYWVYFTLILMLTVVLYGLYGVNIVRWRNSPDFGWRTMYDSGPNVVAEVFEVGKVAGLRVGDHIQAINGQAYTTFDELFFKNIRQDKPGSVNTYTVMRAGKTLEISITTSRLGLSTALWRSGPLFLIGLVYVIIGVLVFLMKPHVVESWLFFAMTCLIGMRVSYAAPSDLIRPTWFYDVRFLIEVILPASMIHLALRFPKTRTFLLKKPWLSITPYLLSFILFGFLKITSTNYINIPRALFFLSQICMMLGILVFLVSMTWNFLKDASIIIRLQSQVIFIGIILGFFIPVSDLISRSLWHVYLFPDPALGFAFFLSIFPLSIGYTIVKHDLFAIDVIVRRTYGYVLLTAAVVAVYALLVSILNVTFQSSEVSSSPLFSLTFALGLVFFFEPLHRRLQNVVDRVFYRQHYDYRKTIKDISETMLNVLDADVIYRTLIGSVVKEMSLENGLLLLPDPKTQAYHVQMAEGTDTDTLSTQYLYRHDAIVHALYKKNDVISQHDIALNPRYDSHRETLRQTYLALSAELMLPLRHRDEMLGIISLGRKKSGKLFTQEDLDLLRTMTNQSAIALDNARAYQEIEELNRGLEEKVEQRTEELRLEQEKLKEVNQQLEVRNQFIRTTFGRYVSDEVVTSLLESAAGLQLGGEKRKATILMSDLRGFTSLSERLAPEQVVTIVNRYLGVMVDIILRYQGTINEFIGDSILVIFGAPMQREDDAQRAVACAVAMQQAMVSVNAQNRRDGLPEVEMGIGVHTGEVVVGNIGSQKRMKYGVVGSHVNLTSRIESYTIGGQILISSSVLDEVGPILMLTNQLEVEVKGLSRPIALYDVRGIGGEYNLFLSEQEGALLPLQTEIPLCYTFVDGKHLGHEVFGGHLVKLSAKRGEIRSDHPTPLFSNIKMQLLDREGEKIPGDLYGKVVERQPDRHAGFVVHFTSIPPEATEFLQRASRLKA